MGECEEPIAAKREIRILEGQDSFHEMYTIIHECLHAAEWHMFAEEFVEEFSWDLAIILDRLGYKRGENADEKTQGKANPERRRR